MSNSLSVHNPITLLKLVNYTTHKHTFPDRLSSRKEPSQFSTAGTLATPDSLNSCMRRFFFLFTFSYNIFTDKWQVFALYIIELQQGIFTTKTFSSVSHSSNPSLWILSLLSPTTEINTCHTHYIKLLQKPRPLMDDVSAVMEEECAGGAGGTSGLSWCPSSFSESFLSLELSKHRIACTKLLQREFFKMRIFITKVSRETRKEITCNGKPEFVELDRISDFNPLNLS